MDQWISDRMRPADAGRNPAIARRQILRLLAAGGVATLLGSCGGAEPSAPIVSNPSPAPAPAPSPSPSPTPTGAAITMLSDSIGVPIIGPLASRSGRVVHDWAIGDQTSTQVVNRALGVSLSIQDMRVVAGPNSVLAINGIAIDEAVDAERAHLILSGAGDEHNITGFAGTLHGRLARRRTTDAAIYEFTPDIDQPVPATFVGGTAFRPDFPAATVVYLAGRNNFFALSGRADFGIDRIVADARRILAAFPRVLVLAVSNSDVSASEHGPSGSQYLEIAAINSALANVAGRQFLDHVRAAKDRGLQLAGLTADAQSGIDAARDVISHQLRVDAVHPNAAGGDVYAQIILARLNALGW